MRPSPTIATGTGLVIAAAVVAYMQTTQSPVPFDQTFYLLATLTGINIILAVSLNMVNGFTGQFSLGHAAFLGIGMYSGLYLADTIGPSLYAGLPGPDGIRQAVVLSFLLIFGGILAALGGLLVGLPSLRLRGDYLAIVTLGFGEILRVVIQNIQPLGGALGYQLTHTRVVPAQSAMFFWVALFAILSVVVSRNLMLSGPGRAFLAVREDEIAAESVGVNTYRAKVLAFVISSMFAGFAGVLSGIYAQYVDPQPPSIGFLRSIEIVVMVVLGGLGSVTGAVVAASVLTALPYLLREVPLYQSRPEMRLVTYSLLLILLMLLRPQGIFGTRELSLERKKTTTNAPPDHLPEI